MSGSWPWYAVAGALGAYHGIDPSMGWLFAVALGLQERRRSKVLWALAPLGIGHVVSIAVIVAAIAAMQSSFPFSMVRPVGAGALVAFGVFRFAWPRAHPRWVAMRVNFGELALWSFLMASAHGAGLMLFPILIGIDSGIHSPTMMHADHLAAMPHSVPIAQAAAIVLLHTGTMLLVMGAVAIVVYEKVGLAVLRSAWINLDTIWAGALVAAGILCLAV